MHSPVSRQTPYFLVNHPLWTLLLWLRHRPLTRRFELSSPLHRLLSLWKLFRCLTQASLSTVTHPQENNALLFHRHGDAPCLTHYMVFLIQESERPRSSSLPALFGLASMLMFAAGLAPVYSVNVLRSSDTPQPHSHPSQPLMLVSMSFTLTLLDQ